MSATSTQSDSTDSNQTVAVIPTGLTGNPYYLQDEEQYADMVEAEVENLAAAVGGVADVIVRGSYELAQMFEEQFDVDVDTDSHSMDFRTVLDDEGDDEYDIPSVIKDGQPVVEHVEAVHGSAVAANFDLSNSSDRREYVGNEVLNSIEKEGEDEVEDGEKTPGERRIGRAKAKSKGKATDQLLNDYFDWMGTADHVIILEDGTDSYEDAATEVRGNNDWVKVSSECEGEIRSVQMGGGENGVLNWTHAMLVRDELEVNELSDSQIDRLNETLEDGQLESLNVPIQSDTTSPAERDIEAEAQAVAGEPAPADD